MASAAQPLRLGSCTIRVGVDPATGCRISMVVPLPCTLAESLKLQITRSPSVSRPAVAGAMARPYGFWSPLVGSTVEPMVVMASDPMTGADDGLLPPVPEVEPPQAGRAATRLKAAIIRQGVMSKVPLEAGGACRVAATLPRRTLRRCRAGVSRRAIPSATSPWMAPRFTVRLADRRGPAELAGAAWEVFSSLLFISAVLPEVAFASFTPLIFFGALAVSAAI